MTSNKNLLYTGIGGTVIAALCCFTPLLVVLFGVVGLSAWLGWIDYVLFPALGFFMLLTVYALYRQSRKTDRGWEDQMGTTWSFLGRAIAGPNVGMRLEPIEYLDTFWFAWAAFMPNTRIQHQFCP